MKRLILALCAALTTSPVWGAIPAHPGMLNYVEGQASIDGRQVTSKSVGSEEVDRNQVLQTAQGKAEILLTPGVFLRLGDNSTLRMISPGLTDTRVELVKGEAMVEVADLHKENSIRIIDHSATIALEKNGLYGFNADNPEVSVFDGKATVYEDDQHVTLKKGKETDLKEPLQAVKFDRKQGDALYNWSSVRSQYLSEASAASARTYFVSTGGWYGGGWYWNPYFGMYSYLPGDGFLFSPFGYGFYSPSWVYRAPVVVYRGRPVVRQGFTAAKPVGHYSSLGRRMSTMRAGGGRRR